MKISKLIEVLQGLTPEQQELHIITAVRNKESGIIDYRGISQVFQSKDVLGELRIVLADGTKGQ